jgi:uncharacterized protein
MTHNPQHTGSKARMRPVSLRSMMKSNAIKIIAACALFTPATGHFYAQTDAKRELAVKVANLQKGPEMERMLQQLTRASSEQLVANWAPRVQNLPEAKRKSASDSLNGELKKFEQEALKIFSTRADKLSGETLAPSYAEKFSEDELKQLVAMLEAPVFKKYQTVAPELGGAFVQKLIDNARPDLEARAKVFDTAAAKVVGVEGAAPAAPAPAAKASGKK